MVSRTRGSVESGELAVWDGRRHLNLTQDEREALANRQKMEQAIALFLDLQQDHTWKEIADTLGMSLSALKRMTQTGDFQRMYDDALATVGHDPRLQAIKSTLGDLLPAAYRRLHKIISSEDTDDRAALRAIEKLFSWTGVEDGVQSDDPTMFANFLKQHGAAIAPEVNSLNLNIPPEYLDAYSRFLRPESTDTGAAAVRADSGAAPAGTEVIDAETVPVSALPARTASAGSDPSASPVGSPDGPIQ